MYDIIARRRLSTVLRYIFDFLPKEETSIHLNTKRRPYRTAEILIHVYNAEHFSSRRKFSVHVTAADKSRRRTLSGICLPVPGKLRFPFRSFLAFRSPLFTAPPYAFLNSSMPTRLRYGGRQIKTPYPARSSSFRFRASRVSPSALFSPFGFRFLPRHRMRF